MLAAPGCVLAAKSSPPCLLPRPPPSLFVQRAVQQFERDCRSGSGPSSHPPAHPALLRPGPHPSEPSHGRRRRSCETCGPCWTAWGAASFCWDGAARASASSTTPLVGAAPCGRVAAHPVWKPCGCPPCPWALQGAPGSGPCAPPRCTVLPGRLRCRLPACANHLARPQSCPAPRRRVLGVRRRRGRAVVQRGA